MLERLPKVPTPTDIIERLKVKPPSEIIDPSILQTILLDEVAGRLEELGELTQQFRDIAAKMEQGMLKVPEGIVLTIERTITGQRITRLNLLEDPEAHDRAWFSAVITNDEDSANNVQVAFNTWKFGWRSLRASESCSVDFHAAKLTDIYFKCANPTDTANIIILGEY